MKKPTYPIFLAMVYVAIALGTAFPAHVNANSISLPKLPKPKHSKLTPALKKEFEAWNAKWRSDAKECLDMAKEDKERVKALGNNLIIFEISYHPIRDDQTFYSVAFNYEVYCGGPYPSRSLGAIVFDIGSSKIYDPTQLYRIVSPNKSDKIDPRFRRILKNTLLDRNKNEHGSSKSDNDCRDVILTDQFEYLEDKSVGLTPEGLWIYYTGSHVVQACYDAVVIPYAKLKPSLNQSEASRLKWQN